MLEVLMSNSELQQRNMIETTFKTLNWHFQDNQLYKLRNMGRGAYWARVLITANAVVEIDIQNR